MYLASGGPLVPLDLPIEVFHCCRMTAEGDKACRLVVEYTLVYVTSVNALLKRAIERGGSGPTALSCVTCLLQPTPMQRCLCALVWQPGPAGALQLYLRLCSIALATALLCAACQLWALRQSGHLQHGCLAISQLHLSGWLAAASGSLVRCRGWRRHLQEL